MYYKKYLDRKVLQSVTKYLFQSENDTKYEENVQKNVLNAPRTHNQCCDNVRYFLQTAHIFRYSSNPSLLNILSFHSFLFGSKKILNTFSCMFFSKKCLFYTSTLQCYHHSCCLTLTSIIRLSCVSRYIT